MTEMECRRYQAYEEVAAALHERGYFSIMPSHIEDIERQMAHGITPDTNAGRVIASVLARHYAPGQEQIERLALARALFEDA